MAVSGWPMPRAPKLWPPHRFNVPPPAFCPAGLIGVKDRLVELAILFGEINRRVLCRSIRYWFPPWSSRCSRSLPVFWRGASTNRGRCTKSRETAVRSAAASERATPRTLVGHDETRWQRRSDEGLTLINSSVTASGLMERHSSGLLQRESFNDTVSVHEMDDAR